MVREITWHLYNDGKYRELSKGLEIPGQDLGETDPRFGETCMHVAEAHVQAVQMSKGPFPILRLRPVKC